MLLTGCKDTGKAEALAALELSRGEVLLCGSGQFGKVAYNFGCNPDTRENFNLALALLHSFEYTEAEKSFVSVIDSDPECAMAYWGIAMSNFHPLWAPPNSEELKKGSEILALTATLSTTERERDYLDAISAFYSRWQELDHKTRTGKFEDKMAALARKYPDDPEATIFYALALNAAANPADKTYAKQRKAGAMLEKLFTDQPDHPGIAHYIIHNYDYPELAGQALPTARRYAQIAPASAHAQHMPSHIFTRLGLWDESIQSNLKSTSSAVCYAEGLDKEAHWDEELHGMDYLVYAYLQEGDTKKALEQLAYMNRFKKIIPINFKVAYTAAAIPSRIALENRDWAGAAKLVPPLADIIAWEEYPWQESIIYFAKGVGMVRSGETGKARETLLKLNDLHKKIVNKGDEYSAQQVEIQMITLDAWIHLKAGDSTDALALMQKASSMEAATAKHPVTPGEVIPAGELLGDLLFELGKYKLALDAYESDMLNHPNRLNGLYGAAISAAKAGMEDKALVYYKKLVSNTNASGEQRMEVINARTFVSQHAG
jgi:tetratricopeptide (TPR) repeat protein